MKVKVSDDFIDEIMCCFCKAVLSSEGLVSDEDWEIWEKPLVELVVVLGVHNILNTPVTINVPENSCLSCPFESAHWELESGVWSYGCGLPFC